MNPMTRFLLSALLLLVVAGCSAPKPTARFTVFPVTTSPDVEKVALPYNGVRVRMAEDLRAYNVPLCFAADGTVVPYRALNYYAPLEVALERALEDASSFTKTRLGVLKLKVRDYCLVEQSTPQGTQRFVRVTLRALYPDATHPTFEHSVAQSLSAEATPAEVRDALATALMSAYRACAMHEPVIQP